MKILNELVELANKANAAGQGTPEMVEFRVVANPDTILAIAEAFRALEQRAEAAEAKLAELEKQEPYGFTHNYLSPPDNDRESIGIFKRENRHYGRPLFTRPAPAINLAELEAKSRRITVLREQRDAEIIKRSEAEAKLSKFVELVPEEAKTGSDIAAMGWNACRAAILRNIEEAK